MIIILSPAKSFKENPPEFTFKPTMPGFLDESQMLVNKLQKQSLKSLEDLMSINPKIARTNQERYKNWELPFTPENAKPAAYLFRGEVYIGLDATSLDPAGMEFAQENLRILSGMYGLLRPMDLMQPYRLEMGTALKIARKKNLYDFWGSKLGDALIKDSKSHKQQMIINLASAEYFRSVQPRTFKIPVTTPTFKENRDGSLKSINVYAKRARGLMARYIIDNQLEKAEDMKSFNIDGYRFSSKHSDEKEWVFVRPQTGPQA